MDWRSCPGSGRSLASLTLKVGVLAFVLLVSNGWSAAGSAKEKPTLIALTLGTEEGQVTIVVPEGKTATHRDYSKGIFLAFVPTVQDLAGGDVDVQVFSLRDGSGVVPERQKELGHISAKLGFRDVVKAVPHLELTVTAIGRDRHAMAKLTGRQCTSSDVQPSYAGFGGGGGCCVSCGGSTSCGCAVGGGCGSCCGGCCAW